jgi:hypothetical protein
MPPILKTNKPKSLPYQMYLLNDANEIIAPSTQHDCASDEEAFTVAGLKRPAAVEIWQLDRLVGRVNIS